MFLWLRKRTYNIFGVNNELVCVYVSLMGTTSSGRSMIIGAVVHVYICINTSVGQLPQLWSIDFDNFAQLMTV